MQHLHTRALIQTALMTAMLSAFSILAIPLGPIPITLQAVFFILNPALLGAKKGAASICLYLLIGLLGMPVFAGGSGGFHHILTPSFGYILGALAAAPFLGREMKRTHRFQSVIGKFLMGLGIIYAAGITYAYVMMNGLLGTPIGWKALFVMNLTTFLPFDLIKVTAAAFVYCRLPKKYLQTAMTQIEKK